MEYQISNRAKKVTLGLAVLGLIMLVFGFFQQKDYIYVDEVIDEHSLTIKYNGEVTKEKENTLKEKIKSTMEEKGYSVTIEKVDDHHGHEEHAEVSDDHEEGPVVINKELSDSSYFIGLEDFELTTASNVDGMLSSFNAQGQYKGQVSGKLHAVCQKAGCWITMQSSNEEEMRIFFKDHFTIPIETPIGTDVVINGIAKADTFTVDFQKHLLDDSREAGNEVSEEEYNAITEDKIEISFEATGIIIYNQSEEHDHSDEEGHDHADGDHDHSDHEGHDHAEGEHDHAKGDNHDHHGPTIWLVHLSQKEAAAHSDEESSEHADEEGHSHSEGETHDHDESEHAHEESAHHAIGHGHDAPPADMLAEMIESGEISFFDTHYRRFWSNLLINGFFFFGIALGALFYLALHYATESGWGVVLLRVMEGIMSAMPIGMAVLAVVFIAGTLEWHHIYPWMIGDTVASDDIIYGKTAYLNKPFFWIRVVVYFATFYLFMKWFKKKSRQEDQDGGTDTHFKMYRRGALFLVFFAVFSSTMSWDFIMSIDTHWYSTLFGWYVFSGIWLSGMVMVMMVTLYLRKRGFLPHVNESHIHDVGKWMFALSFLWSYLWFSQFMLYWYANIPEEVHYFYERIHNYKFIYFGTFFINFVFPMVFLMSRDTKRSSGYLIVIGLIIFIGHWLDVFNMVMPGTLFDQWGFGLLEIGMFLIFLGVFVYAVLRSIAKAPLLQKNHPYLEESKHHDY